MIYCLYMSIRYKSRTSINILLCRHNSEQKMADCTKLKTSRDTPTEWCVTQAQLPLSLFQS